MVEAIVAFLFILASSATLMRRCPDRGVTHRGTNHPLASPPQPLAPRGCAGEGFEEGGRTGSGVECGAAEWRTRAARGKPLDS